MRPRGVLFVCVAGPGGAGEKIHSQEVMSGGAAAVQTMRERGVVHLPNVLDADGDTPLAKAEYDQINFGGWAISTLLKDHGALALIPEEPYDEDHWTSHWEKCCTRASDRGLDDDVEESVLEPLPPDVARRRHTIR